MIKNIIFDLGNVILEFNGKKQASEFTKIEEEKELLNNVMFSSQEWLDLDRGTLEVDTAIEIFKSKLPDNLKNIVEKIMNTWSDYLDIQFNMLEVVKKLKENGYKTYILSNAPVKIEEYLNDIEFIKYFDGRVISALEKVSKPEKEIYLRLFDKYNLVPEESFFIDDKKENIDAANSLGMKGHIHDMNNLESLYESFKANDIKYE